MTNTTTTVQSDLYDYFLSIQPKETAAQVALRDKTAAHPMRSMQILPEQAHLLAWLVRAFHVKKIVELGVFTGYSTLAMAQALPKDGQLIACDISAEWTAMAKQFWQQAGVDQLIDLRIAPAKESLQKLIDQGYQATVDMIFIDADKRGYPDYYESGLSLLKSGGLLVLDNVFIRGRVLSEGKGRSTAEMIRQLNDKIRYDKRVDHVVLPMSDGVTLVRKL